MSIEIVKEEQEKRTVRFEELDDYSLFEFAGEPASGVNVKIPSSGEGKNNFVSLTNRHVDHAMKWEHVRKLKGKLLVRYT